MRSETRSLAAMLPALCLASTALAGRADAGALDWVDEQRRACFIERLKSSPTGTAPAQGCFRLDNAQTSFMEDRRREFCEDPERFCYSVKPTPGSAKATQVLRLFVSPRCETTLPFSGDVDKEAYSNASDLMYFVTDPDESRSRLPGARFEEMMRLAWGCDKGAMKVVNGDRGAEFRKEFDCSAEKMPFDCPSGRAKTPLSPDKGFEGRRQLSNIAFEAAGAVLVRKGDRCVVQSTETSTTSITHLPLFAKPGESYESYAAKAKTPMQLEELRYRTELAEKGARRMFNAAAVLMGADSSQFRFATRAVATPERLALARKSLETARQSVIDYLLSQKPPAPQIVVDRIRNTGFNDLESFTREPPSEQDLKIMENVEKKCKRPKETFGVSNSSNYAEIGKNPVITICPRQLLEMDLSTPSSLISLLAHEFGHSVDPCELAYEAPEARACMSLPPLGPTQSMELATYTERLNGPDGYVSCLHKPVPPSGQAPIHAGSPALTKKLFDAILKDGPSCQQFNQLERCTVLLSGPGQPFQYCSQNQSGIKPDPVKCPTAAAALEAVQAVPVEQAQETYADYVSSQATISALARKTPGWDAMERPEKSAEILTCLSHWCFDGDVKSDDEHSSGGARIATFASHPEIRATLGCNTPPAHPERFPIAACASKLPVQQPK